METRSSRRAVVGLGAAGALAVAGWRGGAARAEVVDGLVLKRFASPRELAAYTRYDAIEQPLVMAHRAGYLPQGAVPECTIEGAALALRSGPVMIEIAVRTTADGELVVVHDETLDRGTTGSGPVAEQTAAEVAALHLKDNVGAVTPYRVPTFDQFLAWGENGALLWLDLKVAQPEVVVAKLREHGARARVVVSAYGIAHVRRYAALDPELVFFVPVGTPQEFDAVLAAGMDPTHLIGFAGFDEADETMVEVYHSRNIPTLIDLQSDRELRPGELDPALYRGFVDRGIRMINTDHYQQVLQMFDLADWA